MIDGTAQSPSPAGSKAETSDAKSQPSHPAARTDAAQTSRTRRLQLSLRYRRQDDAPDR